MNPTDTKFLCIHGHFYQPPRENPWLEEVEVQDSAHPFHDWNERIVAECYAPNAASRLLDKDGLIAELVDNYRYISFNFGPTLLTWMERHTPDVHRRIVESDRASVAARSGHGNALAQVYNHIIMPLASRRDKVTQVRWGIRDFERRFGRPPEGMWLAETAADTETLEVLAEHGIKFTLLSPYQARRARPLGGGDEAWQDASDGRVDPSRPYRWISPRGAVLDLFFYDGPISRAVAFEGLLSSGEVFAARLMQGFSGDRRQPQLVHISTDGESYGHHHRFGDMALAYALKKIDREGSATLTNYGEFLERFPPEWEVEIHENSSWSCFHGIERWRSDCGCRIGAHPSWNQKWRGPLRDSLDVLRDELDRLYEAEAPRYFKDPWAAREGYVDVIADRGAESVRRFFESYQAHPLNERDIPEALKLLEMQRHRLYMFTSCGWFFDDISGLESVTVMLSAARAVQLARAFAGGGDLEERFLEGLARARSNIPQYGTGADVYDRFVRPVITDLSRIAAHEVIRGLFQKEPGKGGLYCYSFQHLERSEEPRADASFFFGGIRVASSVTRETQESAYAVLRGKGHDLYCVLGPDRRIAEDVRKALDRNPGREELEDVLSGIADRAGARLYSLKDLLLEDRRHILRNVIRDNVSRFDGVYRQLVGENRQLMEYLKEADVPIPSPLRLALQYVLEDDLWKAAEGFRGTAEEGRRLSGLRHEARRFKVPLDMSSVAEAVRHRVEGQVLDLRREPDPARAGEILFLLDLAKELELDVPLWRAENIFYELWMEKLRTQLDGEVSGPLVFLARRLRFLPAEAAAPSVGDVPV